jgi:hypothetical protein
MTSAKPHTHARTLQGEKERGTTQGSHVRTHMPALGPSVGGLPAATTHAKEAGGSGAPSALSMAFQFSTAPSTDTGSAPRCPTLAAFARAFDIPNARAAGDASVTTTRGHPTLASTQEAVAGPAPSSTTGPDRTRAQTGRQPSRAAKQRPPLHTKPPVRSEAGSPTSPPVSITPPSTVSQAEYSI